jgi:hypothetical protein
MRKTSATLLTPLAALMALILTTALMACGDRRDAYENNTDGTYPQDNTGGRMGDTGMYPDTGMSSGGMSDTGSGMYPGRPGVGGGTGTGSGAGGMP